MNVRVKSDRPAVIGIGVFVLLSLATIWMAQRQRALNSQPSATKQEPDCSFYASRYSFDSSDAALCAKYRRSEEVAKARLEQLRKFQLSNDLNVLCNNFRDAVDLERWALADAAHRLHLLEATDEVLRNIRLEWTFWYGEALSQRLRDRQYEDVGCPVPLRPDNFVFARPPSVSVTALGALATELEEVFDAYYWRRLEHGLPQWPVGFATRQQLADAKKEQLVRSHTPKTTQ